MFDELRKKASIAYRKARSRKEVERDGQAQEAPKVKVKEEQPEYVVDLPQQPTPSKQQNDTSDVQSDLETDLNNMAHFFATGGDAAGQEDWQVYNRLTAIVSALHSANSQWLFTF